MTNYIAVGLGSKGLVNNLEPFNIDNTAMARLVNAYIWRGRAKRKRGTSQLGRLNRYFDSTNPTYTPTATVNLVADAGNLITDWSLESTSGIFLGSVVILDTVTGETFTDPAQDGTLTGDMAGTGTINYGSGAITLVGSGNNAISAQFRYYPALPVMGLEEFNIETESFQSNLGFDTHYSYHITTSPNVRIYDVSFFKNLPTGTYTNYVQKTNWKRVTWNGQDYQQFWSTNYLGAFWATNGITVPFNTTNIGMPFKAITGASISAGGPPAVVNLTVVAHGLVVGDFVFINEVVGLTGINFQTGFVTSVPGVDNIVVEFPAATVGGAYSSGGICQYLTNLPDPTKDCMRWYDGDPTDGSQTAPVLNGTKGWVNFCPPISQSNFSIGNKPAAQYYLVSARMVLPYKNRLLFLGPVVQASNNDIFYLKDFVVYSQDGTPYYTCSFTGDPDSAATVFTPILTPTNQTATAGAYFSDQTGFGGFVSVGIDQAIQSAELVEDVIIVGLDRRQTRLVFTNNDIVPFEFYSVDSEFGSSSPFSTINLGSSVLGKGSRGFINTDQVQANRFDLEIPDEVFQVRLQDNGEQRISSIRDFINEYIYYTYSSNQSNNKFPDRTLFYNYRNQTWAIFDETYTTYGSFRRKNGYTWANIGLIYPTWRSWNDPWNAGLTTLLQPEVIAGTTQGFVMVREEGTNEGKSMYIQNISGNTVTSTNHNLISGDYLVISDALGTVAPQVNGKIFRVGPNVTANTFLLDPPITGGTYLGGGNITRMYVPFIQTKQFNPSWSQSRKTRIGVQQYLLTRTFNSQIQVLIYLSQNGNEPFNEGPIYPDVNATNDSIIYDSILYTCQESTNLGLTAPNVNLQQQIDGQQIWHRQNTSLIGDTVQLAFTMSEEQMRDPDFTNQYAEIELHGFIIAVSPSQMLS